MIDSTPQPPVELLFLGTGAGDWPKSLPPEEQTYTGNRDFRRFSSLLVQDNILIDCGPSLLNSLEVFNVNPAAITDLLLTHTHWDHLNLEALQGLVALRPGAAALRLWGHPSGLAYLPEIAGVERHPVQEEKPFTLGNWSIESLRANHWHVDTQEQVVLYLFTWGALQWFYATDTSWLPTPTYLRLQQAKLRALIVDATFGDALDSQPKKPATFAHNTLPMLRLMVESMRRDAILDADSWIVLTHLARRWHPPQGELEDAVRADGFVPAYDGMRLRL